MDSYELARTSRASMAKHYAERKRRTPTLHVLTACKLARCVQRRDTSYGLQQFSELRTRKVWYFPLKTESSWWPVTVVNKEYPVALSIYYSPIATSHSPSTRDVKTKRTPNGTTHTTCAIPQLARF